MRAGEEVGGEEGEGGMVLLLFFHEEGRWEEGE